MGAALPVVGSVVGGLSAVSQMSAQQKQADAQRRAIAEQQVASETNTQLRLIELERQKDYAANQALLDRAGREANKIADQQLLATQRLEQQVAQQAALFENEQARIQQQMDAGELRSQAADRRASAQQEATGIRGEARSQATDIINALANEGGMYRQNLQQTRDERAGAMNQFASQGTGGISQSDLANLSASLLQDSEGVQGYVGRSNQIQNEALRQIVYSDEFASLVKKMGFDQAAFLEDTAQRSSGFADEAASYNRNQIRNQTSINRLGLDQMAMAQDTVYALENAQSALNQSFYEVQRQSQASAIQSAGLAEKAALAAQRSSIRSPSLLDLAGPAVGIAQAVNGYRQQQLPSIGINSLNPSRPGYWNQRLYPDEVGGLNPNRPGYWNQRLYPGG
jgi:hypothetical protein